MNYSQKTVYFINFSVIQRFQPLRKLVFYHVKDTVFLHVKILVQRSSEKPRRIFYWINQIQCFISRILVAICWFQFVCRTFIFCEQNKSFWEFYLDCTLEIWNLSSSDNVHISKRPFYYSFLCSWRPAIVRARLSGFGRVLPNHESP